MGKVNRLDPNFIVGNSYTDTVLKSAADVKTTSVFSAGLFVGFTYNLP